MLFKFGTSWGVNNGNNNDMRLSKLPSSVDGGDPTKTDTSLVADMRINNRRAIELHGLFIYQCYFIRPFHA